MVIGCENYLEKYQPLFTHRQISEALDQVATSVKLKWRLKKFAEKQANVLIDRILADTGQPDLKGTIDKLKSTLKASATPADEINPANKDQVLQREASKVSKGALSH